MERTSVLDTFKYWGKLPFGLITLVTLLALVYGFAVPASTVFCKNAAEDMTQFLFLPTKISPFVFWTLALFSAAVSLKKVFDFLAVAFKSRWLAFFSCAAFEFAFLNSTGLWFAFFFLVISLANVFQAGFGLILDEIEKHGIIKDNDTGVALITNTENHPQEFQEFFDRENLTEKINE